MNNISWVLHSTLSTSDSKLKMKSHTRNESPKIAIAVVHF